LLPSTGRDHVTVPAALEFQRKRKVCVVGKEITA
jgi:hypothetical protein